MIAVFVTALGVSLVGMTAVLPLLRRAQVMDVPNARSSHAAPTPRGGGIAVIVALLAASLVGTWLGLVWEPVALFAVVAFAALGMVDDLRGLDVSVRLLVQLLMAVVVAVEVLGVEPLLAGVAGVAIATVWLVGYTNAFNFMDGVNGISALNAVLAGGWYTYLGVTRDVDVLVALGSAVVGAALGFLPWNAPRARVFLGDVGSYGLGLTLGLLALLAWAAGVHLLIAIAPLTVYLADTSWALVRRVLGSRPWHEAHREHVYQRLTDYGWSHLAAASAVALVGGVVSLALNASYGPIGGVAVALALVLFYLSLPSLLGMMRRQI